MGGGAAGLSAALVLARARRKVLVIDGGTPRNAPAAHLHGFLSRDGVPPAELLATGRAEMAGYGGEIRSGTVTDLVRDKGFRLRLGDGHEVTARRLLVATGLRDELPDIPGLAERWARDVVHCPYCHGHEVHSRPLGVLGGPPEYAQLIRQWTDDLVYFTPRDTLADDGRDRLAARAIDVVEGMVERLVIKDDSVFGVAMTDGRIIARAALFVPPRFVPNNALLVRLGAEVDDDGWATVDSIGQTSVAGVWAAGNVVNPRAQLITAASEGSAAAIGINTDLVAEDVRTA